MMKDPQNAMKYMQTMGATTDRQALQAEQAQSIERIKQVQAEEKDPVEGEAS